MKESSDLLDARKAIESFENSGRTRDALIGLENAIGLLDDLYNGSSTNESRIAGNMLRLYFQKAQNEIESLLNLDTLPDEKVLKFWYIALRCYKDIEAIDQNTFTKLSDKMHAVVALGKEEDERNLSPKRRLGVYEDLRIKELPEDF